MPSEGRGQEAGLQGGKDDQCSFRGRKLGPWAEGQGTPLPKIMSKLIYGLVRAIIRLESLQTNVAPVL